MHYTRLYGQPQSGARISGFILRICGFVGKSFPFRLRRSIFAESKTYAMKKLILLLSLLSAAAVSAQDNLRTSFQFSLFPPLGTNGTYSGKYSNGASVNLLVGLSANERSFALGGFANIILNDAAGLQIAGLANYIGGSGKGMSLAGMTNVTRGTYSGVQIAGLANFSKDVSGLQAAGLFNVAGKVKGVQLTTLVNVAEDCPWPIGLINIIKNGEMGSGVSIDALGNATVALRSGGKYSYGILGFGINRRAGNRLVAEAGYGIHAPICGWFRINNEFKATNIGAGSEEQALNLGWLLAPSFVIWRHLDVFAGAGLNWLNCPDRLAGQIAPGRGILRSWSGQGGTNCLYIGFQAGIQYLF